MPAKQMAMSAFQVSDVLARRDAAEREAAMRNLCSLPPLSFWKHCRDKRCRRMKRCAGDADACFTRHWRLVAADLDKLIHAHMRTGAAGIVRPDIEAELDRRLGIGRASPHRPMDETVARQSQPVIAGLDPAIHEASQSSQSIMDCRVSPLRGGPAMTVK
jgi:hypothetical protein